MKLNLLSESRPWTPKNSIRVFPVRTKWTPIDPLAFIGECPLFHPQVNLPVLISVTFSWHIEQAEHIADSWREKFSDVRIGGPAYDDPGSEFIPGLFLPHGCTITSRGCPKKCGWCSVPSREGSLRELPISPGWIVQDNNILACSEKHVCAVFDMLREQKRPISFNGGLDKHFIKPWHRELFDSVPIDELWFACDTAGDVPQLDRVIKIMDGYSIEKMRCYTMIGYDHETPTEADRRIDAVYKMGFLPFCQLYQPLDCRKPRAYSDDWRKVHRKWSRPAIYRSRPIQKTSELFKDTE